MNATEWLVLLGGLAAIVWVNWYFFLAEKGAAAAAVIGGGAQEVWHEHAARHGRGRVGGRDGQRNDRHEPERIP